ncbi:MAG: hypothetical protein CMF69_06215 [Magnetovibrio sp.]|nr:hypothetical protein [Magnetovibrio sp.]
MQILTDKSLTTCIRFAGLLSFILTLGLASNGEAARKRIAGQWAYTDQPYWKVGALSKKLSNACQRGEFGQRKLYRLSIGYVGGKGRGITGIANTNWNLHDPKRLAEPRKTYHFFNQGYSNCKVYVADTPMRRGQNTR